MTSEERWNTQIILTVDGSRPLIHSDGTTAIMLQTREQGTIAYRQAIDALRQNLNDLEILALRFLHRIEVI